MTEKKGNISAKNFDVFRGLSRATRSRKALSSDYVKVDERELPDLLNFTNKFASYIRFYDENKDQKSTWQEFFDKDDLILLISAADIDLDKFEDEVNQRIEMIYVTFDDDMKVKMLNELVRYILVMANEMTKLRKNISRAPHTQDLIFEIGNAIQQNLKPKVLLMYSYKQLLNWSEDVEAGWQGIALNWGIDFSKVQQKEAFTEQTADEFKEVFQIFFYVAHHLMKLSKQLLDKVLNQLQDNKPHIALFITFLKLFQYTQDSINTLTERHLNYYYRQVLQQKEKAGIPDKVNISFTLKPGLDTHFLDKGTTVNAEKNKNDEPLIYQTLEPVLLSSATIRKMNTIFLSRDPLYGRSPNRTHYTSIFSKERERAKIKENFAAFGEDQFDKIPSLQTLDWARLGWSIESPVLEMAEGNRTASIELFFSDDSFEDFLQRLNDSCKTEPEGEEASTYKVFSTGFEVSISTAETIQLIENYGFSVNAAKNSLTFFIELNAEEPSVNYIPPKKRDRKTPEYKAAFMQIELKRNCSLYMFSLLKELQLIDIRIQVVASGIKNIKSYNNYGEFVPDNPVQVFGAIPEDGSYILLGNEEAYTKELDTLGFDIEWYNLPFKKEGIKGYFQEYGNGVTREDYQYEMSYLSNGKWTPEGEQNVQEILFEEASLLEQENKILIANHTPVHVDLKSVGFKPIQPEKDYKYDKRTREGFLKLTLKCPDMGFGHASYSEKLSDVVLYNSRRKKGEEEKAKPKPPVAPMINNIRLNYSASVQYSKHKEQVRFFQLTPFGYQNVELKSKKQPENLVYPLQGKAELLMGLDKYPLRGEFSVHFEMNENFYEEVEGEVPPVTWYYLAGNSWYPFSEDEVIKDTTLGFIHDGVIRLRIPKRIKKDNTILDADLYWIKATINYGASIRGVLTNINENAVEAIWNGEGSGIHLNTPLPVNTIKKLENAIPEVVAVKQSGESFGGRRAELPKEMITRVSERLRNKGRAINARDYEELVLEQFPLIYKAKCFVADYYSGGEREKDNFLIPPGKVVVAIIPDISSDEVKDKLRPNVKAYLLMEIRDYLKEKASPFVDIEVCNPFYEEVKAFAKVKFQGYESDGYYLDKLNKELIEFLNPWMLESSAKEENFGNSIYRSDVLGFIQNRSYVEFVTGFSLVRLNEIDDEYDMFDSARKKKGSEEIKATYPWSIMTSAKAHSFEVIDDITYYEADPRGIDNMELESDFIIE